MKKALIIFVRNPVLGKVKTRLARTIGDAKALNIYIELLSHTISITSYILCDKFVYYSDFIDVSDGWDNRIFEKRLQEGHDLGLRMKHAFNELLHSGYDQVLIIGSDCYQLTPSIIECGFAKLQDADAVMGPSEDGGYYLLGLKNMHEKIFENKSWSTENVSSDTINDLKTAGLSYSLLIPLKDIDVEADLQWMKH